MKRKTIVVLSLIILLVVAGVWWSIASNQASPSPKQMASSEEERTYSESEVADHDTKNDCWTIIGDNVYDLTTYVNRHPGGKEVLRACGQDASRLFEERSTDDGVPVGSGSPHSPIANEQLARLKIGTKL